MTRSNFGSYVKSKRISKGMTLREMAGRLSYSATFWSDVENQRRNPPNLDKLELLADILELTNSERSMLFDLAGKAENITPPDLTGYILEKQIVRRALRVAKETATDEQWNDFIDRLEKGDENADF
ncbi:MAG: helix-turn-helix domain-containing protein [Oscillospiraceae bacterium]|nr:helix-turn-helix domain-containing protein [Oscillospiraceae bacterium]